MARRTQLRSGGFSIIEILITVLIIGLAATIAVPSYKEYRYRIEVHQAISEIGGMSETIKQYTLDNRRPPDTLADVGLDGAKDPWGEPYYYTNLQAQGSRGKARKDRKLNPLNSDFDLYSSGRDKDTVPPLPPKVSHDDVLRANDGGFVGLGKDF